MVSRLRAALEDSSSFRDRRRPSEPRFLRSSCCRLNSPIPTKGSFMFDFRSVKKAIRKIGRKRAHRVRPTRQPRLSVERLDERSLPSASFLQTNLVSDLPGLAQLVDTTLHGAQGISLSPNGGAFWVSSNGGNLSELYLGDVNGTPIRALFKVAIPGGSPTGQLFNLNQPIMSNGNS